MMMSARDERLRSSWTSSIDKPVHGITICWWYLTVHRSCRQIKSNQIK